jgi:hypothetical protein
MGQCYRHRHLLLLLPLPGQPETAVLPVARQETARHLDRNDTFRDQKKKNPSTSYKIDRYCLGRMRYDYLHPLTV